MIRADRNRAADEELRRAQEAARLTWRVRRDGRDVVISLVGPRVGPGGFERVATPAVADLGPAASAGVTGMVQALTRAREGGPVVAIQGFAAVRAHWQPITFVLSVALARVAFPEAAELPEESVVGFELACGSGVRILRVVGCEAGPDLPRVAQLTATYLAPTDHGALALAFATPHLDGADGFLELFDAIAATADVTAA